MSTVWHSGANVAACYKAVARVGVGGKPLWAGADKQVHEAPFSDKLNLHREESKTSCKRIRLY